MLTLKQILESARMMEQTGGQYKGFHEDHIPEHDNHHSVLPRNYQPKPREKTVKVRLDYESSSDGDVRIVQR